MLPLLFVVLLQVPDRAQALPEPDGSRTFGIVPPYRADPFPPDWLRAESHRIARVDTRRYRYEAYAGSDGRWLVRYAMLPDTGETCRRETVVLVFRPERGAEPTEPDPGAVTFGDRVATWKGATFKLVDQRRLLRPESGSGPSAPR